VVVRSKSADEALELARAAADGGIKFVEITFSVPGALDVIKELSKRNDIHVGAGTVLAPQQAERAVGVGAEFIVSPSLELNIIGLCHAANVACFPGAATPTEIVAAQRAHADLVKIFPADLLGGTNFIRQMQAPFADVRFMVSGGVNVKNVTEYVQLGVTGICLGSAYLGSLLAEKGKKHFLKEMQRYVKRAAEAQGRKETVRKAKR
jgi:2-dehydro-3-deoxyphosphogluconate aldolase/(4S)-4-hydroxy-2-oxoglutarate aldolase